jgi:sugar phosphate permease
VSWFNRRRSLAMGLALLGSPIGGLALPVVVAALEHYGWRPVAVASGVIVILVGMPLAQVVRHRPEQYGLLPDGELSAEPGTQLEGEGAPSASDAVGDDYTAREAMRTRAFWFISIAHASAVLVVSVVQVHFVAHVNESLGYSLTAAASLLTFMTVMNFAGRVGGGYLGDRLNTRFVVIGCMLGHAAALVVLAFASSLWMLVLFAALNGVAWGARAPVIVSMRADYFGARSYGTIMGFSSIVVTGGAVLGPVLGGLSYDITGSYTVGFTALAVLAALGAVFPWLLPAPGAMRRTAGPA